MYLWRKYDQLWDVVVDLWFCCSFKTPWFWDGSWSGSDLLPMDVVRFTRISVHETNSGLLAASSFR